MTIPKPPSMCDTECYKDYWLCMFDTGEYFEMWPGQPLDANGLSLTLQRYRVITFNGNGYDMPLITLALQGHDCATINAASDSIILDKARPWDIARVPDWIDHIDLMEVLPGQASLKMYGGKMHSRRMQDLPIEPGASIHPLQRTELRKYCRNDLRTTRDAYEAMRAQLALREDMSAEYGIDLRSKSDAQMAEAVMKRLLAVKVTPPYIAPGTQFYYRPPEWLRFIDLRVLELLERSPFVVAQSGSVEMSDELERTIIRIGNTAYKMGIGGLHSMESIITHRADDDHTLTDHDVASYYPSLILQTGIYPQQIGPVFAKIYRDWYDKRLAAKRAGIKKTANSLKTLLNGTFGKLGSVWSIFYAPSEMIQVTVTGQLALLMLIEMLESCGVPVVSANTDGIVLRTPKRLDPVRDDVIRWWETLTGFDTERTDYRLLTSRDVNSYVAIKTDGEVKLKGAYAPPEPGPSGWPNPTGQVSTDAVVAYLKDGTPLAATVYGCTDVRQFVHVRQVKGGGSYCPTGTLPAKTTQREMRAACGDLPKEELLAAWADLVAARALERQYLGRAVRWYFSKGSQGCIVTPTGGLVARTDGCKPLMVLPDTLPDDIDHEWYITEARGLLADLGVAT